jgi:Ion channel
VKALGDELRRLLSYEERHRRLLSRLALIVIATCMIDVIGSVAMYMLEHGAKATEVTTFGQAVFFTTVQLLTVSSQIRNPVTPAGRVVDVALELWGVVAVAGSAGAVASFFQSGDAH